MIHRTLPGQALAGPTRGDRDRRGLASHGKNDENLLARAFAERYMREPRAATVAGTSDPRGDRSGRILSRSAEGRQLTIIDSEEDSQTELVRRTNFAPINGYNAGLHDGLGRSR